MYWKQLKWEQIQEFLLKVTFDNNNEDCQELIKPQREIENVMDFLRLHRNVGAYKQKAKLTVRGIFVEQKLM